MRSRFSNIDISYSTKSRCSSDKEIRRRADVEQIKNWRRPDDVIHRRADGKILHRSAVEPMMNRNRPDDVIHQRADVDPMRKSVVGPKKSR